MKKTIQQTRRKEVPFGKILSGIMKERQLTLKMVAQMAGVSVSVASDWTAGNTPRDLHAVFRLAQGLGIDFSRLLLGEVQTTKEVGSISELFEETDMFEGLVRISIKKVHLRNSTK
ncbi:helix-turn-helix domain-containing protein [Bdellovibrio sp. KM01]|uniref:helix-turn-helix domain-containing protein n=1 Tax=Bdellovibrio sp. KM01 TaxID=2748865 RepID=UPI0015E90609|nr:helix-turn-helix transcriptional regulator [Bdellovibrio sp. KM01]QLY24893.1 helix-turn-helix transcriptional regulator [Bdellovibrio sp. KM01]